MNISDLSVEERILLANAMGADNLASTLGSGEPMMIKGATFVLQSRFRSGEFFSTWKDMNQVAIGGTKLIANSLLSRIGVSKNAVNLLDLVDSTHGMQK